MLKAQEPYIEFDGANLWRVRVGGRLIGGVKAKCQRDGKGIHSFEASVYSYAHGYQELGWGATLQEAVDAIRKRYNELVEEGKI